MNNIILCCQIVFSQYCTIYAVQVLVLVCHNVHRKGKFNIAHVIFMLKDISKNDL